MIARTGTALRGTTTVPGDKSMSHRALILGSLAVGRSTVSGLLAGDDVMSTAAALRAMGAEINALADGSWEIHGVGVGGLGEPSEVLDLGNAGTGVRLMMGVVATHPITAIFTGDASLRRRPMARVTAPLARMGAEFIGRRGGLLPMAVVGSAMPMPIRYELPVASAQVKSAIMLAALNTPGITTVIEPTPTRDHSERMLRHFGAEVGVEPQPGGGRVITVTGQPELYPAALSLPGDPSSAAFPMVAALITPGSELLISEVGLNPLRTGIIDSLLEMGADLTILNARDSGGEPVGDLRIRASSLTGVTIPAERAPAQIDEYPILAIAAAFAAGRTVMPGLEELKVKESDRLAAVLNGLKAAGVKAGVEDATLTVEGTGGGLVPGGVTIAANLDHRIAMAFLVLGLRANEPIAIDDGSTIDTSFPGFAELMRGLGADIRSLEP